MAHMQKIPEVARYTVIDKHGYDLERGCTMQQVAEYMLGDHIVRENNIHFLYTMAPSGQVVVSRSNAAGGEVIVSTVGVAASVRDIDAIVARYLLVHGHGNLSVMTDGDYTSLMDGGWEWQRGTPEAQAQAILRALGSIT